MDEDDLVKESKRYLGTLLERHYVADGIYLFTFVSTSVGYYLDEEKVFIDEKGNEYSVINSEEGLLDNIPYVYADIIDLDEMIAEYQEKGGSKDSEDEIIEAYDLEQTNYYYLASIDDDLNILCMKYDYNSIINTYKEAIKNKDNTKIASKEIIKNNLLNQNTQTVKEVVEEKKTEEQEQPVEKETIKKNKFSNEDGSINVNALTEEIKKTIIGQDEQVKRMVLEIDRFEQDENRQTGILLTGPTGVGKTLLMTLISKYIDRPFIEIDSTQLTSPGYEGRNIEEYLWDLYEKCDKDLKKTENAIVYFDEIDKKGSDNKSDVAGKAVLNVLLKFFDGTTYKVSKSTHSVYNNETVNINTSKMIVIAGGAFTDVYEVKEKNPVGFNKIADKKKEPDVKDFVNKAMMTHEFMGRVPVIIKMNDLDTAKRVEILKKSDKSPIKTQRKIFDKKGTKIDFTDEVYEWIAKESIRKDTGARGLDGIVLDLTYNAYDEVISNPGEIENIIINEETTKDNTNYIAKYKEKQKVKKKK